MLPLNLRLPNRSEVVMAVSAAILLLFISWVRRGQKIASLETLLTAKPKIEFKDRVVEKRVVVEGPVRIVKVKAPDGSVTTTTDRGPETISTNKEKEVQKTETPICPPPSTPKSRYAGLVLGPNGYSGTAVKGFRGGINVFENWDLGGNIVREKSGATVLGLDMAFRW